MQTGEIMWAKGELLGEGAYGKVFAGLNQLTGELMAVKQLKVPEESETGGGAEGEGGKGGGAKELARRAEWGDGLRRVAGRGFLAGASD